MRAISYSLQKQLNDPIKKKIEYFNSGKANKVSLDLRQCFALNRKPRRGESYCSPIGTNKRY